MHFEKFIVNDIVKTDDPITNAEIITETYSALAPNFQPSWKFTISISINSYTYKPSGRGLYWEANNINFECYKCITFCYKSMPWGWYNLLGDLQYPHFRLLYHKRESYEWSCESTKKHKFYKKLWFKQHENKDIKQSFLSS